jgi:hypothetical protein
VRDGVERVGDCRDARGERDRGAAQRARVAAAVPSLVVREDAGGELRVERGQRLEHLGAAQRVDRNEAALVRREGALVVHQIEERGVDLSYVVKERDALDAAHVGVVEPGGVRERDRVRGDAADVGAGLRVVGVDRVEERLEGGGGETLGNASFASALRHVERGAAGGAEN